MGVLTAIFTFIVSNKEIVIALILSLYEVFVSLFPTSRNWSILSFFMNILRKYIPNRTKEKGLFKEVEMPKGVELKRNKEKTGWEMTSNENRIKITNSHGSIIRKIKISNKTD